MAVRLKVVKEPVVFDRMELALGPPELAEKIRKAVSSAELEDGRQFIVTEDTALYPHREHRDKRAPIYHLRDAANGAEVGMMEFERIRFPPEESREMDQDYWVILNASIDERYRSLGLGKFLYRTVINDMLRKHNLPISSAPKYDRSADAERVWESLLRTNPFAVDYFGTRYIVYGNLTPKDIVADARDCVDQGAKTESEVRKCLAEKGWSESQVSTFLNIEDIASMPGELPWDRSRPRVRGMVRPRLGRGRGWWGNTPGHREAARKGQR